MDFEESEQNWIPKEIKVIHNEDNIQVRTIYVTGVPPKTKKEVLQNHFETNFGNITSIRIHKNFKRPKFKTTCPAKFAFAFITFSNPESAAKAIHQKTHLLDTKRLKVFAADTWHQPKDNTTNERMKIPPNIDINVDNSVSLLQLDDYCLLHICKYLKAMDVTKLSMTCSRLYGIAEIIFRKYSKFSFVTDIDSPVALTLDEVRMLTAHIGRYIRELSISGEDILKPHQRHLNIILKDCNILESIHLIRFELTTNILKKQSRFRTKLKTLILENCIVSDQTLSELFSSPVCSLKRLKLISCRKFDAAYPIELNQLEDLHIENCSRVDEFFIEEFLRNSTIKRLTVLRCVLYSSIDFPPHVDLSNLEYLKLSSNIFGNTVNSQTEIAKRMTNLKCLHLPKVESDIGAMLTYFSSTNQLEELDISSSNTPNTSYSLLKLTNLRVLKVDVCNGVNEELLIKLATKMNLRHLSCGNIEISETSYVKILELSENLESLESHRVTVVALQEIIFLLNVQKQRPKLKIIGMKIDSSEARDIVADMEASNRNRIKLVESSTYYPIDELDGNYDDNSLYFSDDYSYSEYSESDEDENVLNNPRNYVITDSEDEIYNL